MMPADWMPHDDARSNRQISWICQRAVGLQVLDLGCGSGRVARRVSDVASRVVGVDLDPTALDACRGTGVEVMQADIVDIDLSPAAFDLALCLGNTFALLWDVDVAVRALACWRRHLNTGGCLVLDDLADDLWGEVAAGNWATGMDASGEMQLVWAEDDAVLAVREGEDVDPASWVLRPQDRRMRIWTAGALRLAARAAGFQPPRREPDGGVLVLQAAPDVRAD